MRKCLVIFLLAIACSLQARQTKILWIGNSYIEVNNLPEIFRSLALSGGDTVTFDYNTPGGQTLQQHAVNATTIQKIYSQNWDYVVLQAQSQEPSFPPAQVQSQTYPYARLLDSLIHDNDSCTQTVFYMTWGKKYGDQMNCSGYPVLCTFEGVTSRLRESYLQMGDENHALIAPAGMAWQTSWHSDTLIDLWIADNSHPSVAGSYLTACVFYETIFRKSTVGLSYSPLATQATTNFLQSIAHHTVYDSTYLWNLGEFTPHADFEIQGIPPTLAYTFQNLSLNSTGAEWHFGDGAVSTTSGQHVYDSAGTYIVTLVVFDGCGRTDTSRQTLTINPTTEIIEPGISLVNVYPNPFTGDKLTITVSQPQTIIITDIQGKEVYRFKISTGQTNLEMPLLAPGIYFVAAKGHAFKLLKL